MELTITEKKVARVIIRDGDFIRAVEISLKLPAIPEDDILAALDTLRQEGVVDRFSVNDEWENSYVWGISDVAVDLKEELMENSYARADFD